MTFYDWGGRTGPRDQVGVVLLGKCREGAIEKSWSWEIKIS